MKNITIHRRGTITLPKKIRSELDLSEGSSLRIFRDGSKVILEPIADFDTQLIKDIHEGLEDIRKGKGVRFATIKELHQKLDIHDD